MITLLVSDSHLGSPLSRARELLELLQREIFNRLIMVGDIFADLNFTRLTKDDLKLLNYLRKLMREGIEVIWIFGNHDAGIHAFLLHLAGIDVVEEYEWEWNGERCLALHGHQFDSIVTRGKWITMFISFIFLMLQKVPWIRRNLAMLVDTVSSKLQWLTPRVAEGALRYAKAKGVRYVFCGHTHERYEQNLDGVTYFNTGCWVGNVCSFIRMTDLGIQPEDEFFFDFSATESIK